MRRSTAALWLALATAVVAPTAVAPLSAGAALPVIGAPTARSAPPADTHLPRRPLSPRAKAALGPAGELRGVALNDQDNTSRVLESSIVDFPRLAQEGVTSVAVYVYLYVASPTASEVTTGFMTPQDAELSLVTRAAKANGLDVHLMPVLMDEQLRWRGTYVPADKAAFYASYTSHLLHYADLAQAEGVSMLYVGSELRLLQQDTAQWRAVIAATRAHYTGALTYLATPGDFRQASFWDRLDLAAVSPYFSMGTDPLPTYDRDVQAWKSAHLPLIARLVKHAKIPVIYGEVGFNSQKGSFDRPEVAAKGLGSPAPAAQADAYRALLDVMARTPGVYGVSWYRWKTGTTIADMSWSPAGKPAECVLAAHWSTDANVRAVASGPVCDLHALDVVLAGLPALR